jgi:hypothetical protein
LFRKQTWNLTCMLIFILNIQNFRQNNKKINVTKQDIANLIKAFTARLEHGNMYRVYARCLFIYNFNCCFPEDHPKTKNNLKKIIKKASKKASTSEIHKYLRLNLKKSLTWKNELNRLSDSWDNIDTNLDSDRKLPKYCTEASRRLQ